MRCWEHRFSWKRVGFETTLFIALLSLLHLLGGVRLAMRPKSPSTVRVAGINVRWGDAARIMRLLEPDPKDSDIKSVRAAAAAVHDTLFRRSEQEVRAGARIVAWSEANGLVLKQYEPALITRGREFATKHKIHLFMAIATATPGSPRYENQLVPIDPERTIAFRYHKTRPVPGALEMGADRSIPKPFATPSGRITGAICFDMDFPGLIRRAGRGQAADDRGASFLTESWMTRTAALLGLEASLRPIGHPPADGGAPCLNPKTVADTGSSLSKPLYRDRQLRIELDTWTVLHPYAISRKF